MPKKNIVIMTPIIVMCLLMPVVMPILTFADSGTWSMECGNINIDLNIVPYENELGLMANAEDAAKAFSFDYEFDRENKAFIINDEKNGKVVLMHNATQFYSGDKTFDCAPYFYVENTVPMVEMDFFCKMFGSSYEVKENKIIIYKNKLSEDVAKLTIDNTTISLYIEPHKTELGLITGLEDAAKAFGLSYTYNSEDKSTVLSDAEHGDVILNDGAETFTSNAGKFECAPFYFVQNGIPMIEIGFFCEMYDASYSYDDETKNLVITKNAPTSQNAELTLMSAEDTSDSEKTISGLVKYSKGAPSGGLNVKLLLQQKDVRYELYKGYIYTGETYNIGTVHLNEGETSKKYSYDISQYATYPYYSLFYAEEDAKLYGVYSSGGTTIPLATSDTYYSSNAMLFSFGVSNADIDLDCNFNTRELSGKISLENNVPAPSGGMDVRLILQTRSERQYKLYAPPYYIGSSYNLGKIHFSEGEREKNYSYDISSYYTDNGYSYYTLFYASANNGCVKPYGYYNDRKLITTISTLSSNEYYTDSWAFSLIDSSTANLILPLQNAYLDKIMVKSPTANYPVGEISAGTSIELSCTTNDAVIYYTTDGTEPSVSSMKYSNPIPINETTTIKAVAVKEGMENSFISTFVYTVSQQTDILCGDINNDGTVNRMDLLRLSKYFSGWDVEINEQAADVTGDGAVNRMDLLRLSKYFSGWDVILGDSSDNQ